MNFRRLESPTHVRRADARDPALVAAVAATVARVRQEGEPALRLLAAAHDGLEDGAPLVIERSGLLAALALLPPAQRELLERSADRIRTFATAQRRALGDARVEFVGGFAAHAWVPVDRAGCYAPGGRFPLPSSVLMTAVTARTAGVGTVWVASPRPALVTLAAAAVAGADGLLRAGGAQAIAAMAYGAGAVPACDVIAGPGNRWVTAAKHLVAGDVGIDLLAGPSELVVLADAAADPGTVAADLLAQAEHDAEALPVLVTTHAQLVPAVTGELERQLATLPGAPTARQALANGGWYLAESLADACNFCDAVAPEHLQVTLADPDPACARLRHFGALFTGRAAAEVFGDYGAGPNHVLPTGGGARFAGGLSVLHFLRLRTELHVDAADLLASDAAAMARLEGLEGHARAAERRRRAAPYVTAGASPGPRS